MKFALHNVNKDLSAAFSKFEVKFSYFYLFYRQSSVFKLFQTFRGFTSV